ncbi:hypothetical protein Tco_0280124, partial [Tanacetum coccineum]
LAELVLWASLEFHSRGPEFDSCLIPIVIIHVSIHVDATWAHVADTWIYVAYHVATRPTVDPTVDWWSTTVDLWLTGGLTVAPVTAPVTVGMSRGTTQVVTHGLLMIGTRFQVWV